MQLADSARRVSEGLAAGCVQTPYAGENQGRVKVRRGKCPGGRKAMLWMWLSDGADEQPVGEDTTVACRCIPGAGRCEVMQGDTRGHKE